MIKKLSKIEFESVIDGFTNLAIINSETSDDVNVSSYIATFDLGCCKIVLDWDLECKVHTIYLVEYDIHNQIIEYDDKETMYISLENGSVYTSTDALSLLYCEYETIYDSTFH